MREDVKRVNVENIGFRQRVVVVEVVAGLSLCLVVVATDGLTSRRSERVGEGETRRKR